jgi:murein DD-endopeptidase MepM/ murein hydrolase activator NlpD
MFVPPLSEIIILCGFGAIGALFKDVVIDGKITMPARIGGDLALGFMGSLFVGAIVGYIADNSPLTAFCAGFAGFTTLAALIPSAQKIAATSAGASVEPASPDTSAPAFSIRLPFSGTYNITQKFGVNPSWYKANGYAGHFGIDYATPHGTPILACDSGTVSRAGFTSGNGYYIELMHSWGKSLYCHLSGAETVSFGVSVSRGEQIGKAGNTGAVKPMPSPEHKLAGTHLHFSISVNGVTNPPYKNFIDPTPFFC